METRLVHAGEPDPLIEGAVSMPVFQSSTYEYTGQKDYHDLRYIRLNNTPNHRALHEKLAQVENGESAIVTSSGMSAISTALLTFLEPGDHILVQDCLYGGTHELVTRDLARMGIFSDFIDGNDPGSWETKRTGATKIIYVETITNPLMQVADLEAVVSFAEKHGLISMIDNTFAGPTNFRPLDWGFNLSLHSCTKYLNGHSDIVAGAVIGSQSLIDKIVHKLNHLGGSLDPHACFLLHRGMKTLALRMAYQNKSARAIAEYLESHEKVSKVHYPGLESHPDHLRAKRLLDGFGGMISFELKDGLDTAEKFIRRLSIPICAPSLGGVESLITRPASTSHSGMAASEREKLGITDALVRFSVGIESTMDLIDDIKVALKY